MLKKVILLLALICAVMVLAAAAQDRGLTFVGKIEEIALKTNMTPLGAREKILALKLDTKPKLDFRMTARDATRYKLIDASRPSAVLTPGQVNGVGWKVRLTCNKITVLGGTPYYMVVKLEKLD
jgi:hypothetical protein